MIVDCHAHVIQNWIGACGHPTRDLHMKYLQRVIAGTVARTYRARDGAPADTKALIRADDPGWSGLRDVDFRVCRSAVEFTVDGGTTTPSTCRSPCKPGSTAGADAVADDLYRRRSCGAAGRRRLWRNGTWYNALAQLQYPRSLLR